MIADFWRTPTKRLHMSPGVATLAVLVSVLLPLISSSTVAIAATPPQSASRSVQEVCQQADLLTDKDEPQKALDLIRELRKESATPGPGTSSPIGITSTSCAQEMLNAQYAIAKITNIKVPAKGFPKNWEKYIGMWSLPPYGAGLGLVVMIAISIILARLLSQVPIAEHPKSRRSLRVTITWVASLLVAGGAIWPTILLTKIATGVPVQSTWIYISFIPITVGTLTLSWAFAQRMRMRITVRDAKGKITEPQTSQIVALLRELGNKKSYGVDVPLGTGTKALTGSTVIGTPENRIMAILQVVFENIIGITPWHVIIDSVNEDTLIVVVMRNSRSKGAAHLNRKDLGLHEPPTTDDSFGALRGQGPDLHKMAAAVIIATLAMSYKDFQSLCGATQWKSIGFQYIAATDYIGDSEAAKRLLINAVQIDCKNLPASLMLHERCYKIPHDATPAESGEILHEYANWLLKQGHSLRDAKTKKIISGYENSYFICLNSYLTTVRNLRNIEGFNLSHSDAHLEADELIAALRPDSAPSKSARAIAALHNSGCRCGLNPLASRSARAM